MNYRTTRIYSRCLDLIGFVAAIVSAQEVEAALDVLHRFDALSVEDRDAGHKICEHVANMLRHYR